MKAKHKARQTFRKYRETSRSTEDYWLARFLFLRILGFTYFFAFLSLFLQLDPLLGNNGLTPVASYLSPVEGLLAQLEVFSRFPTLFWFNSSDGFMFILALIGLLFSALILVGFANLPMLFANWLIYLSFVNAGQVWYGYGWEIQLLETGFLALLLVPLLDPRPFRENAPPPRILVWLLRWLAIRVHLGSGFIKLKGSECWQSLTCLERYFETQPIPNPVSPWMHYLPSPIKKLGVAYTHAVQLLAPYSAFFRPWIRHAGGLAMLSLQLVLIMTGNLSFLNWLTIASIIPYFDDDFLSRFLPSKIVETAERAKQGAELSEVRYYASVVLMIAVMVLSIPVVINIFSPSQAMNTSFNQWHVVNTYGAFGSVRQQRTELVVEGTRDHDLQNATWREYDFRYKPDQEDDPLPVVAPYQPRIAWQMWFASFSRPEREPWLLHLTWKLLHNDPKALRLVKENPFQERPPNYIRIQIYRFEYRKPWLGVNIWNRTLLGTWMPPVARDSDRLENYVERRY